MSKGKVTQNVFSFLEEEMEGLDAREAELRKDIELYKSSYTAGFDDALEKDAPEEKTQALPVQHAAPEGKPSECSAPIPIPKETNAQRELAHAKRQEKFLKLYAQKPISSSVQSSSSSWVDKTFSLSTTPHQTQSSSFASGLEKSKYNMNNPGPQPAFPLF